MPMNEQQLAAEVAAIVRARMAQLEVSLRGELSAIKTMLSAPEFTALIRGPQGDKGPAGKDAEAVEITHHDIVSAIKQDSELLAMMNGKAGRDGKDGVDGIGPSPGDVAGVLRQDDTFIARLKGADGRDGPRGENGRDGKDGVDGKDGLDGRDALQIQVMSGIDQHKRYQRGTWAAYQNGLVRSVRATDPLADGRPLVECGWEVVVSGAESETIFSNDFRVITTRTTYTDGRVVEKTQKNPAMIYRGIYKDDARYDIGDVVTRSGCQWVLVLDCTGKPGDDGSGWQMSVKSGRDGRDGVRGAQGDRGAEGRAGKDLTHITLDGQRY